NLNWFILGALHAWGQRRSRARGARESKQRQQQRTTAGHAERTDDIDRAHFGGSSLRGGSRRYAAARFIRRLPPVWTDSPPERRYGLARHPRPLARSHRDQQGFSAAQPPLECAAACRGPRGVHRYPRTRISLVDDLARGSIPARG